MANRTLLIVDDEDVIVKNLKWALKDDYDVVTAQSREDAFRILDAKSPSLMLLDLSLTGDPQNLEGFDVLETALIKNPLLKVIMMTGHDEHENALRAIEKGAYDFYSKPVSIDDLKIMLSRAAHISALESEIQKLRKGPTRQDEFSGIIAMSEVMQGIFDSVRKIAPTDVSVLITGESGTGKELVAHAIHELSTRNSKPFAPINCGAIPENLLESELFGHEKGSFTGAHATRPGKFEVADGGTIFLDEIGELGAPLQVKLLRFLQDQTIERVGGREPIQVNVRVVAATNQKLEEMIAAKRFREDLFYRINAIRLKIPPLRERGDDVLLVATRFLHRYNAEFSRNIRGFSDATRELIYRYHWPGNVRELENRIKRAVLMAVGKMILPEDLDLPATVMQSVPDPLTAPPDPELSLGDKRRTLKEARDGVERQVLIGALLRNGGNVTATARELEISRPTLHDLMKKHGITPESYRARG